MMIFLPTVSDYDTFLFGQGDHHRIYEKLRYPREINGVRGLLEVWALLKRVAWGQLQPMDGRIHQMRMLEVPGFGSCSYRASPWRPTARR